MPAVTINFTHEQYNRLFNGARDKTGGNISEYIRKYCRIEEVLN